MDIRAICIPAILCLPCCSRERHTLDISHLILVKALMLAAAADSCPGCEALLGGAATLELADALGRTALMFAAGNDACAALASLLDAGASVRLLLLPDPES